MSFGSRASISPRSGKKGTARRRSLTLATVALLVTGTAVVAGQSAGTAESFQVSSNADAYTVDTVPTRSTGSAQKIAIGFDGWAWKSGYVKFDTGPGTRGSLELVLEVTGGLPGTVSVHHTATSWTDSSLTAATAPAPGSVIDRATLRGGRQTLVIPVGYVAAQGGEVAFALVRPETGTTRFASHETATPPLLRLAAAQPVPQPPPPPVVSPSASPSPTPTAVPSTPPVVTPTSSPSPTVVVPPPAGPCPVTAKLVPTCGAWFGVAPTQNGGESYEAAITRFESAVGRPVDVSHYYARGQDNLFPSAAAVRASTAGGAERILFYNWRPLGVTWRQIADGATDDFLRDLAAHIKATHNKPFFLSLNAEPEEEVVATAGSQRTAKDYADFFRHVITTLRANGATNVVSVMNYIGAPHWGDVPWFEQLYPGDDVVDWIAEDPYVFGSPPVWLSDFATMVDRRQNPPGSTYPGFYSWAQREHPSKPIMLGEWGVDDVDGNPSFKPNFFDTAASQMAQFPNLKALIYWDHPGGMMVGDTTVSSSTASQAAARRFANQSILKQAGDVNLR